MRLRRLFVLLFTLLATAVPAFAQQPDPNVSISIPRRFTPSAAASISSGRRTRRG